MRLGRARRAAGRRQEDVAARFGYGQSDISRIEKGERRVDVYELEELADYYNTTVEALRAPETPEEAAELDAR